MAREWPRCLVGPGGLASRGECVHVKVNENGEWSAAVCKVVREGQLENGDLAINSEIFAEGKVEEETHLNSGHCPR